MRSGSSTPRRVILNDMRLVFPRFRISLRTFLIATTIVGGGIGLLIHRHVSERAAEVQLVTNGLSVSFEPWGGNGQYWAYDQDHERKEAVKTFVGRLKWRFLRHAKYVNGQRSAQLSDDPSQIGDDSIAPLEDLRHVEILYLGFQPISDDGLTHLGNLRFLKHLNLCGTKITDDGLSKLTVLSNLEYLAIEFTDVSDVGLRHIGQLRKLGDVAMMDTKITGPGLKHIGNLRRLESLGLSKNPIRSDDLRHLTRLKNLKTLYLSNTEIDDSAAIHIGQLTSLETLWIENAKVGDEFIAGISSLRNLNNLNVKGTQITNASETAICSFPRLEQFYAWDTAMDYDTMDRIKVFSDSNTEAEFDRISNQ